MGSALHQFKKNCCLVIVYYISTYFSKYVRTLSTNIAEIGTSNCQMGVLFLEKLFQLRRMNLILHFSILVLHTAKETSSKRISNSKRELRIKGAKKNFLVNKILSIVPFWNSFWNYFGNSFGLEFLCMSGFVGVQVLHGKEKFDLMPGRRQQKSITRSVELECSRLKIFVLKVGKSQEANFLIGSF